MISSLATGSRTIIFDPGNLQPLTLEEFQCALKDANDTFSWIHFEARPNVREMLDFCDSMKEVSLD